MDLGDNTVRELDFIGIGFHEDIIVNNLNLGGLGSMRIKQTEYSTENDYTKETQVVFSSKDSTQMPPL